MTSKHQTTDRRERHDNETAPARKRQDIELDIEVLEERIAPFRWGGGFSWFSASSSINTDLISLNRCETLVGEGA